MCGVTHRSQISAVDAAMVRGYHAKSVAGEAAAVTYHAVALRPLGLGGGRASQDE